MAEVTDEMVHALQAADGRWAAHAHPVAWQTLSDARARHLLESAWALIAAAEREASDG
jgi:hypothetical protein